MRRVRSHLLPALLLGAALLALAPAALAADAGTIAFQANRGPVRIVYTVSPSGGDQTRVAEGFQPSISRDGKKIAFVRSVGKGSEIFYADADGRNLHQVTDDGATDSEPAFSPDGRQIVFIGDRRRSGGEPGHLFVVNIDGSGERQLTDGRSIQSIDSEPAFSPNGQRIVFVRATRDSRLATIATDGRDLTFISGPKSPFFSPTSPSYSPNGQRVLFAASDPKFDSRIYTADAADGGDPTLVTKGDEEALEPAYSPEGGTIVFRRGPNLLTMGSDGRDVTPLTHLQRGDEESPGEGADVHPSWGR